MPPDHYLNVQQTEEPASESSLYKTLQEMTSTIVLPAWLVDISQKVSPEILNSMVRHANARAVLNYILLTPCYKAAAVTKPNICSRC